MTIVSETIEPSFTPTLRQKLNPVWWLMNGDTWDAPAENNGAPYLPEITDPTTRSFYWWMRNPFANFVGFVIGVEDRQRKVTGVAPLNEATVWDHGAHGWKWMLTWASGSWIWTLAAAVLFFSFNIWHSIIPLTLGLFAFVLGVGTPLPFISYSGSWILFYVGWRYSGGFGVKINRGHALAA